MELGEITRREFLNRSAMIGVGILTGLYSTGCSILYPSVSSRLSEDDVLLINIRTSIKETSEYADPIHRSIIRFSADHIAKVDQEKLFLSRDFVKEEQVARAKSIILQGLGYKGNIAGASSSIYFLDEVPSAIYIRSGFPKYRFDGQVKGQHYLDDRLQVHKIKSDGSVDMNLANHRFSLRPHETYEIKERKFEVEINPQVMRTENDSWRNAYENVKRTSFNITTKVENLGVYNKQQVEFFE